MKLLQKKNCLVTNMCAGSVPHNKTCLKVNMSADPVAMMAGLLVGASRTNMHTGLVQLKLPADPVQQYPAFLLVGYHCNIHYC